MFKRLFALFLTAVCLVFSLCGCKKETVYLPIRVDEYSGEQQVSTANYTYNKFGFVTSELLLYNGSPISQFFEYNYNKRGVLKTVSITIAEEKTEYTAKKVSEYKYNLTSKDGENMVLIFDGKGHIVFKSLENAYTIEQAYTYDKNGKPTSLKIQQISPSGNSKLTEYIIAFTSKNTYEYFDVANDSNHFVVTYEILKK